MKIKENNVREGYIYILFNPSLRDNLLKIGMTTRTPEERAKELSFPSGVANKFIVAYKKKVFDCRHVEGLIHNYFDRFRVNDGREFFELPLADAITIAQRIANRASSLEAWQGKHILGDDSIVYWSCQAGDYISFFRYADPFQSELRPVIVDVWEARDDGDQIVIVSKEYNAPADFVCDAYLSDEFVLRPGDRIAWVGKNRNVVADEVEDTVLCILECQVSAKAFGYLVSPRTNKNAPILFSVLTSSQPPKYLHEVYRRITEMGFPRTWI